MVAGCERYLIKLAYDGTDFHGFQLQKGERTVQGELEQALERVCGCRVRIRYAGRTDAGVHAKAQFVDFKCPLGLSKISLLRALNSALPWDVRVLGVECVPESFHSQYDAIFRDYTYLVYNAPVIPPFFARYSWHIKKPLDISGMVKVKSIFEGERDFTYLCDSEAVGRRIRRVYFLRVGKFGKWIIINIRADGFLKGMVRYIVGILVGVARNRLQIEDVKTIMKGNYVFRPKAPPCGLFLSRVCYESVRIMEDFDDN